MYNFNAHTLNGVAVSYSALPNFALDLVERDERLTLASKMIYMRLLRYAAMIKDTAFKITGSWLIEQLAMNRSTVTRSLVQLKQCGYVTDKGIVIPSTEKAKTIENEQVKTQEKVSDMVNGLLALVGSRKAKTDKTPVQNAQANDAKSTTFENEVMQKAPVDCAKSATELLKKHHPIKNKEENKEKNKGHEPESYPLDLLVPESRAVALAGSAGEVLQGYGLAGYSSDTTPNIKGFDASMGEHREGELITVDDSNVSSDAMVVLNAIKASNGEQCHV